MIKFSESNTAVVFWITKSDYTRFENKTVKRYDPAVFLVGSAIPGTDAVKTGYKRSGKNIAVAHAGKSYKLKEFQVSIPEMVI